MAYRLWLTYIIIVVLLNRLWLICCTSCIFLILVILDLIIVIALLCLLIFGPEGFLIPAMCLITLLLTLFRSAISAGRKVSE